MNQDKFRKTIQDKQTFYMSERRIKESKGMKDSQSEKELFINTQNLKVDFGKHKGKTLPQILCSDPDWFFWAMENNVFRNKGALQSEAKDLHHSGSLVGAVGVTEDGEEE